MLFGTISVFRLTIVEYFQTPEPEDLRLNPIFKYRKYLALSLLATEMGSGSVTCSKNSLLATRIGAPRGWWRSTVGQGRCKGRASTSGWARRILDLNIDVLFCSNYNGRRSILS